MAVKNLESLATLSTGCQDEVEAALTTSFEDAVSVDCRRQIQAASGLPSEPLNGEIPAFDICYGFTVDGTLQAQMIPLYSRFRFRQRAK